MNSIIESIRKVTAVAAFLFGSLVFDSYPISLVWEDNLNLTCWLNCIHKKKKGHTSEVENIFEDYIVFKPRKSIANDQGKRSVLLQAIKASPYLEIDKNLSTPDKKFIRFTEKFKQLLDSLPQANAPEVGDRESEHSLISTNDVNMTEPQDQFVEVASETASLVPDVDMVENQEEFQSFYSENGSSNRLISQEGLLPNESVNLLGLAQSAPLPRLEQFACLQGFEQAANFPAPEQAASLPAFEQVEPFPALKEAEPLLALEQAAPLLSLEQAEPSSTLEQAEPLPRLEQSTYLPLSEKSMALYPPDYDPSEDLLRSQKEFHVSPRKASDIFVDLPNNAHFSAFEMKYVCSVKLEGDRVHMLTEVGPSAPAPPTHHMFSISPKK